MVRHDGFFRYATCYKIAVLLWAFLFVVLIIFYTTQAGKTKTIVISEPAGKLFDIINDLENELLARPQKVQNFILVEDPPVDQKSSIGENITKDKDEIVKVAPEIETARGALNIEQQNGLEPVGKDLQQAEQQLNKTGPQSNQSAIPFILHWSAPSERLPDCYKSLIESCTSQNPDWEYYLWRDEDKREFMRVHYPMHSNWLMKMSRKHQEELFRFFVLMKLGGLFLDLDMQCVSPLTPILSNISIFLAEERPEMAHIVRNMKRSIDDTVIAGAPGHKLFSLMLEYLVDLPDENVKTRDLLDTACESLKENCILSDYRHFGSSLDNDTQWQETCKAVLDDLQEGVKYKQDEALFYKQQGCAQLRDQNWLPVNAEVSTSNHSTVAYHTYIKWEKCLVEKQEMNLEPLKKVKYYT